MHHSIPSCLILDVYLPDFNGLELQKRVADQPELGEDVTQVTAAACTELLYTRHAVTAIEGAPDVRGSYGLKKLGYPVAESNFALELKSG
jgi:hypothetical protein